MSEKIQLLDYLKLLNIWWQSRPVREQKVLIYGAIISLIIILFLVGEGLIGGYLKLSNTLPTLRKNYINSEFYTAKILANKNSISGNLKDQITQSLASFHTLNDSSNKDKAFGVSEPTVNNINGKNYIAVELTEIQPTKIFSWLEMLTSQNIKIFEINLITTATKNFSGRVTFTD